MPSPDFNRLAYRVRDKGRDVLEFRASPTNPDAFALFRIDHMQVGPTLAGRIAVAGPAPGWLLTLAGRGISGG